MILSFLFLFALFIPGIYAASFKNFLIIPNTPKNCFLLRAMYAIPGFSIGSLAVTTLIFLICLVMEKTYFGLQTDNMIGETAVFSSLVSALIVIVIFRLFMLSSAKPFELREDFFEYDFYIYIPIPTFKNEILPYNHLSKNMISEHSTDIRSELKIIDNMNSDISSSFWGEHVISESAASVFEKESLTGFVIRPMIDCHRPPYQSRKKFFLLIPLNSAPPLSKKTKTTSGRCCVVTDDKFIYTESSKSALDDINLTYELFNYNDEFDELCRIIIHRSQNLLVLSQKTVKIMVEQFDVPKRYFLPVYFEEDETPETENKVETHD